MNEEAQLVQAVVGCFERSNEATKKPNSRPPPTSFLPALIIRQALNELLVSLLLPSLLLDLDALPVVRDLVDEVPAVVGVALQLEVVEFGHDVVVDAYSGGLGEGEGGLEGGEGEDGGREGEAVGTR